MMDYSKFRDPDFSARVKPILFNRYKRVALAVSTSAITGGYAPGAAEAWDDMLFGFKHAHPQLTRPKFIQVVASMEFFVPKLRRSLAWAYACLPGCHMRTSVRHTVPITLKPAKLMASHFASRGKRRLGLALIVQTMTGIPPNEMSHILPENLLFPGDQWETFFLPVVISLRVQLGTTSGLAQTSLSRPQHTDPWRALRACRDYTPDVMFMFPYTIMT